MRNQPKIQLLGQSGVRFSTPLGSVLIDPYLTDSVAKTYGAHLSRLRPNPISFKDLSDTLAILVTHSHLDHCDPESILGILHEAPTARVLAPLSARTILADAGVPSETLNIALHEWMPLLDGVRVHAVPAVHPSPDREANGEWVSIGFVLDFGDYRCYHAGDTSPSQEIVDAVRPLQPTTGFLPVNERNYYRERDGIIGNMSTREAFAFAEELGLQAVVPVHWDMFAPNSVHPDEIRIAHALVAPQIKLVLP